MPETPFENDHFFGSRETHDKREWTGEAVENLKKSRRWIRNSLIGLGAILGVAGATMATGYIYFNSNHYKISRLTPKELKRMHFRKAWVDHRLDDPCKIMREEKDYIMQEAWKCHEFPTPPNGLPDLAPVEPKPTDTNREKNQIDSDKKYRINLKRRQKTQYET